MRPLAIAAVLTPLLVGAAPVSTDQPAARDVQAVMACLAERGTPSTGSPHDDRCISVVAGPCIKRDESNAAQVACFAREQAVWEAVLAAAYQTMRAALDAKQQRKLRDMQRAWMRSRALTCVFYDEYLQGSMAGPMIASCENREMARRAIFLRMFARDAK